MADQSKKYVIIGNGIAGTTAAEAIRKAEPTSHVVLITDEPYALYNRVALPPFLKKEQTEQKVFMRTPEKMAEKGIEFHIYTRVTAVNATEKTVLTNKGQEFPYDKLLVATGGLPNPMTTPGAQGAHNVYGFQTFDDTVNISNKIDESKKGVVIGGSFISYELAEAFASRGIQTTWVLRGPWWAHRMLDQDGGELVDTLAREHNVTMHYKETVKELVRSNGNVTGVVTNNGLKIETDMLAYGLGLTKSTQFLSDTKCVIKRGLICNEYLQTDEPDIYAAGDVAEFWDVVANGYNIMGTWANSTQQGKLAAANMMGEQKSYHHVPLYTSGMFSSTIAALGLNGEHGDDIEGISKIDKETKTYIRLFFREKRLVGAVGIGKMKERAKYAELIRSKELIENPQELLIL